MRHSVLGKTLDDQRRSVVGWSVGISLLIAFTIAFWPSMSDSADQFTAMIAQMPPALRAMMGTTDIASASGFLSGQLFALLLPAVMAVLAIGKGAQTVAGEEERGDLELLLARPLPRWRIATEKGVAVLVTVGVVVIVTSIVTLVGAGAVGMDVPPGDLLGAMLGLGLLAGVLASVAFAVGAATGRRGAAVTVTTIVAVASYLASTFSPLVEGLGWLHELSPWTWAFGRDAVREGPSPGDVLALTALLVAVGAVGVRRFTQRDLGV